MFEGTASALVRAMRMSVSIMFHSFFLSLGTIHV